MGFFIRCAFWLGLLLLIIPLDTRGKEPDAEPVGPLQTFLAARDAAYDMAGLCLRQPDVCETGKAALTTVGARAVEAVRLVREALGGNTEASEVGETSDAADEATGEP